MKRNFDIKNVRLPKAAIWIIIGFLFYKKVLSLFKSILSALGLSKSTEEKYKDLLRHLSDQALVDSSVSAIKVNQDNLKSDIDLLGHAFGWKYSAGSWWGSWNPYSWTEDESTILKVLQKYDRSSIKYLDKLYAQRWERESLKTDCLVYLSDSEFEQTSYLWI